MGAYNLFVGTDCDIQLKVGSSILGKVFNFGDKVYDMPDGVYLGLEGAVVIQNSKVVAVTDKIFSKWGDELKAEHLLEPINPFVNIVKQVKDELEKEKLITPEQAKESIEIINSIPNLNPADFATENTRGRSYPYINENEDE